MLVWLKVMQTALIKVKWQLTSLGTSLINILSGAFELYLDFTVVGTAAGSHFRTTMHCQNWKKHKINKDETK